jgi:hypothetical protein
MIPQDAVIEQGRRNPNDRSDDQSNAFAQLPIAYAAGCWTYRQAS